MPHSTSSDPVVPSDSANADGVLPDAYPQNVDYKKEGEEIDEHDNSVPPEHSTNPAPATDVKLEDLFNDDDDDDDEEFPSSDFSQQKLESSPPAAPM